MTVDDKGSISVNDRSIFPNLLTVYDSSSSIIASTVDITNGSQMYEKLVILSMIETNYYASSSTFLDTLVYDLLSRSLVTSPDYHYISATTITLYHGITSLSAINSIIIGSSGDINGNQDQLLTFESDEITSISTLISHFVRHQDHSSLIEFYGLISSENDGIINGCYTYSTLNGHSTCFNKDLTSSTDTVSPASIQSQGSSVYPSSKYFTLKNVLVDFLTILN